MGLTVNVSESSVFSLRLHDTLPSCGAGFSIRLVPTYFGQTVKPTAEDEHMVSSLCRVAAAAFFF